MDNSSLIDKENLKASLSERSLAAGALLSVFAVGTGIAYFNPVSAGFFPACPFHSLTGFNCPGCGLTRGFHALLNGDILTALHFNALLPFYVLLIGYLLISLLVYILRGRGLSVKIFPPVFLWGFLISSLIFGVIRNLPFYPFNLLVI